MPRRPVHRIAQLPYDPNQELLPPQFLRPDVLTELDVLEHAAEPDPTQFVDNFVITPDYSQS